MIDPATALAFSVFENKGVFALLVGSGVSRTAQIPTGWEILLDLTRQVGALEGVTDEPDWAKWHQKRFGEEPNYSRLLDALAQTPDERRAILHRYIEPTAEDLEEGRKVPTRAHRAIARLVRDGYSRVIITTNFDRLTETALRELGIEPTVIRSDDDLQGAVPLIHSRCFIIKVHGDYLDTRLRNTESELAGYSDLQNRFLDRVFDEHGLIVCGWSADWDDALRAAIARAPSRRFPLYWASRSTPSVIAQDLVALRGGRVIAIEDADTFFEKLQRDVEIQATLMRPNPMSVDLLVATAKRYVARLEHRVQLSDLIAEEVRKTRGLLAGLDFAMNGRFDPTEFKRRLDHYETVYEGLIRVLFILGRWGTGDEIATATDLLKALARRGATSGTVIWLGLQTYPAVLILYAFGLGLLKANRLNELRKWLSTPIRDEYRDEPTTAVQNLLLWSWKGNEERAWQQLAGLENHKTPLSEHLHQFFDRLFESEFPSAGDLEITFEAFETFGYLCHITLSSTKDELRTAAHSTDRRSYVWSPVGRIGWHADNMVEVIEAISGPETRERVLGAGFANGDPEFLDLSIQNLKRIFADFRWMRF